MSQLGEDESDRRWPAAPRAKRRSSREATHADSTDPEVEAHPRQTMEGRADTTETEERSTTTTTTLSEVAPSHS